MFHRVDDFTTLPSVRFYSLASRLKYYQGAVRHAALMELAEMEQAPEPESAPRLHAVPEVSPAALAAMSNGWIEHTGR